MTKNAEHTPRPTRTRRTVEKLVLIGLAVAVTGLIAYLQLPDQRRTGTASSSSRLGLPIVQQARLPATPGPTNASLHEYYPIPTHIAHQVVSLATAPDAAILTALQDELTGQNATALSARAAAIGDSYCYYGSCTQCIDGSGMTSILSAFFRAGSKPLIQGYFRRYKPDTAAHSIDVVISGWIGHVALPTAGPEPHCDTWSTLPSLWTLRTQPLNPAADWAWLYWEPIWPYEDALRRLSIDYNYGTYYVIRP